MSHVDPIEEEWLSFFKMIFTNIETICIFTKISQMYKKCNSPDCHMELNVVEGRRNV